jgi:hypothetical protein
MLDNADKYSIMENMKAHVQYSPWINLYVATLLGGEFDNCHGQGKTPEDAIISLKILVNLKRKALTNTKRMV